MKSRRLNQTMLALGLATILISAQPTMANDYTNHWAQSAIDTWSSYGIVKGYEDGTFRPSGKITRGELAAMLDRALGLPSVSDEKNVFTDVTKDKWYADAIASVTAHGLMYVSGTEFKPNQEATREEVAYAMAQAYQLTTMSVPTTFKDGQKISGWAKSSVDALVSQGLIKGYEDGTFKPQASITRAEFVTILDNITSEYITESGTYTEDLEGNVVITAPDVVLKDMTIKGNLYLAPGIEANAVSLENVTVTGTVYIQGGTVTLKGNYDRVSVHTTNPIKLETGTIKNLDMKQKGAFIELAKGTVVDTLTLYKEASIKGEGAIKKKVSMNDEKAHVESAGVYIGEKFVPVDMIEDTIVIDVNKLIKEHGITAKMDSLVLYTSADDVYLKGYGGGKFQTNTVYSFRKANQEIGILQEMIDQLCQGSSSLRNVVNSMGITGNSVFDMMGMGSSIELGTLVDQYYTIGNLVSSYGGVMMPQSFEFKYDLYQGDQKVNEVKIKLVVQ